MSRTSKKPAKTKQNYGPKEMAEALCRSLNLDVDRVTSIQLFREDSLSGKVNWRLRAVTELEDR